MNQQYTLEDFKQIIKMLRSENGCAWDKKQTHESLKPCITEEAAELVSSIRIYDKTGNAENMREELGDILLQVMMHSQIAEEEGLFTLDDVIQDVSEKMVRRHPHVFGTVETDKVEEILDNWEEIKKKEKEGKDWAESPLREIPIELPALVRAVKVLKKVDRLYCPGNDFYENVLELEKQINKLKEYQPNMEDERLKETIGSILINISDICRQFRVSQEQILTDRIEDLIDKYEPT